MVRFRPKRSPQPAVDVPDPSDHGRGTHPAVYVERATKVYNEGTPEALVALEDSTMRVEQGEVVALLGPSGCGKSTLLKMIGGLYPATEGRIFVDGVPVTEPGELTGMMFQKPVLFPWLKVVDNVLLPVRTQGAKRADFLDRANDLIALAGLSGFGQRYPWELSGGMQQRVAICRMLMGEPKVLLLDEPFGALDEMTRERMQSELLRIRAETGTTVVFVTHSIPEAVFLSTRVVIMSPRPGTITEVVDIDLPEPRSDEPREDQHFFELLTGVREGLRAVEDS